MTSDDRQALLNDSSAQESPKKNQSVFDFISFEDRQRLEAAKRKPVELGFKGKSEPIEDLQEEQKVRITCIILLPTDYCCFIPEKIVRFSH